MTRSTRPRILLATLLLCGLGTTAAHASAPVGVYVVPHSVELLPAYTRLPNEVVIQGVFLFLQKDGSYSDPQCGYMHFVCNKGEETMCLMQWKEIAAAIGDPDQCTGFGSENVLNTATLYPIGTPLGKPDPWDLGMGIAIGFSLGGQCPLAHQVKCKIPRLQAAENLPLGGDPGAPRAGGSACSMAHHAGTPLASVGLVAMAAIGLLGARRARRRRGTAVTS